MTGHLLSQSLFCAFPCACSRARAQRTGSPDEPMDAAVERLVVRLFTALTGDSNSAGPAERQLGHCCARGVPLSITYASHCCAAHCVVQELGGFNLSRCIDGLQHVTKKGRNVPASRCVCASPVNHTVATLRTFTRRWRGDVMKHSISLCRLFPCF